MSKFLDSIECIRTGRISPDRRPLISVVEGVREIEPLQYRTRVEYRISASLNLVASILPKDIDATITAARARFSHEIFGEFRPLLLEIEYATVTAMYPGAEQDKILELLREIRQRMT